MSFQNAKVVGKDVDPRSYHDQGIARGEAAFPVSPSMLKEFARCPARWIDGYQPPETQAKDWGNLLDTLLLTPKLFSKRYAIQPAEYKSEKGEVRPWNNNANVCKEWREDQIGKEIISAKEYGSAKTAVERLGSDEIIHSFLEDSDSQVLVEGQWKDEKTGLVIPVRCLMDLVPRLDTEFAKCLGDLKSTRTAALMPFQRFCFEIGYHVQAAFDTDLYVAATGEDRVTWCFIIQESYPPWQTGKRMLSQDFLDLGRADYKQWLSNYCWCLKNSHWPDYDETDEAIQGWSLVAPEPWMATRGQFAPKFVMETEPETEQETEDVVP